MTNWIQLDEIPDKFWGQCFIGYKVNDQTEVQKYTTWVRRVHLFPEWFEETEQCWTSFNNSINFRVAILEYPYITEEDFK